MRSMLKKKEVWSFALAWVYWCNATNLDFLFFSIFNGHLMYMPWLYKYIFALMNHQYENFCDIVFVVSAVSWVLFKYSRHRKKSLLFLILLAAWYELGFQIIHPLEKLGSWARHSPSLEYGVIVDLSLIHPLAKVYAPYSFPSGHAMIFGYFGSLVLALFPKHLRNRYFRLSLMFCLPRLVGGAHALSDIFAGYACGVLLWYSFFYLIRTINYGIEFFRTPLPVHTSLSTDQLVTKFIYE